MYATKVFLAIETTIIIKNNNNNNKNINHNIYIYKHYNNYNNSNNGKSKYFFTVSSFQTIRDWLNNIMLSRAAVFSMAEAFLRSESETVPHWNVSLDEKLTSKMKRKDMEKFQVVGVK